MLLNRSPPAGGRRPAPSIAPLPHDSAAKHVQRPRPYIDDIREPAGHAARRRRTSPARGRVCALELDAVRAGPGVVAVLTASDIPGKNDVSPAFGDDPLLCRSTKSSSTAKRSSPSWRAPATPRAAPRGLPRVEIERRGPSVTIEDALARGETVLPDYAFGHGDAAAAHRGRTAPARGPVPDRRPGAFLSRGPGRARHPRRGRGHARPSPRRSIRPRSSMSSRACSACPMPMSPARSGAWAAASAARKARRRNGRRSRRSPRA